MRSHRKVPKIIGYDIINAQRVLYDKDLKLSNDSFAKGEEEKIYSQEPEEGSIVKKGSTIRVETNEHRWSKLTPKDYEFEPLQYIISGIDGEPCNGFRENETYRDPSISYTGEYRRGIPHGGGTYTTERFTYEGDFVMGFPSVGTLSSSVGYKYEGYFEGGKFNGTGTFTWEDGRKYEGKFVDGKFNGAGTFVWEDGCKYEGNFVDDNFNGKGTLTFASGSKYEGDFVDDKFNGEGTYCFASGNKYVGNFVDGKFNGKGTFLANGNKYEGDFVDDEFHGIGTYTRKDGSYCEGTWRNDERCGNCKIVYSETNDEFPGDVFEGSFRDGMRNGRGIQRHKDGRYYTGTWKNGKRNSTFQFYDAEDQLLREEKYVNGELIEDKQPVGNVV